MNDDARRDISDAAGPRTLAVDVGGTSIKATVLDAKGTMIATRLRIPTPARLTPERLLDAGAEFAGKLPEFDRISLGFPGVVRKGTVLTAPEFRTKDWAGFPLACALTDRLGKPARILNDAEVQGFGDIKGEGLEVVLTLGTGAGTAVFRDGELMPHLELAHHIIRGKMTYNDYVGLKALKAVGRKRWRRRVQRTVKVLSDLLHYDTLYVGGGNATQVDDLGANVVLASNDAGLTGGVRLWERSSPAAGPTTAAT